MLFKAIREKFISLESPEKALKLDEFLMCESIDTSKINKLLLGAFYPDNNCSIQPGEKPKARGKCSTSYH